MTRKSISIIFASAVTAMVVIVAGAAVAAADGAPPVATPPVPPQKVPSQDQDRIRAAAIASVSQATDFFPITPCTIVDTRHGTGTNAKKFKKNVSRSYYVGGTASFEQQGGKAGGCGVPATAKAVSLNATVIGPSKAGSLRIWPAGGAEPATAFLSYGKFTMSGAGQAMVLPGTAPAITVKNLTSTTHLKLDVTGYYMPKMQGMVSPASSSGTNAPIYAGTPSIISATNTQAGVYVVTFDRNITYCTPIVDTYNAGSGVYGAAQAFSGNTATVFTWYLSSTTHLEVPFSFYFYIYVVC